MKSTLTILKVPVTTVQDQKTVNIEMTFDEAAVLFCILGQTNPQDQIEQVEKSIQKYHPQFSYLLHSVEGRVKHLIYDLYDSLHEKIESFKA